MQVFGLKNKQQTRLQQINKGTLKGVMVVKLLMIGNSFCYYYVKELYGMAKAVGIDMEVCNVYYSGCSLKQHWTWLEEGAANYEFFITNENGRHKEKPCDLNHCLEAREWDVISLQTASASYRYKQEDTITGAEPYIGNLYGYLRERFPNARYLWHHTWSSQKGYQCPTDATNVVLDEETQNQRAENAAYFANYACEKYQVDEVPSGLAWQLARADECIGDTLCNRVNSEGVDNTDNHHDGNVGGGRYLNACVWFEVLTGLSCIGSTYMPDYELDVDKMRILQQIAHEAVAKCIKK